MFDEYYNPTQSARSVIRMLRYYLKPEVRRERRFREVRHALYREVLHKRDQALAVISTKH